MKTQHIIPLLLLAGYCTVNAQTNIFPGERKPIKFDENSGVPIGSLGFPVGKYLTVEGAHFKLDPRAVMAPQFFLVDTVNGNKLAESVAIEIQTRFDGTNGAGFANWLSGERFVFKGYETLGMVGTPPAEIEAYREAGHTDFPFRQNGGWEFRFCFVVKSVAAPKEAKQ